MFIGHASQDESLPDDGVPGRAMGVGWMTSGRKQLSLTPERQWPGMTAMVNGRLPVMHRIRQSIDRICAWK
jgi:hypothetical protein